MYEREEAIKRVKTYSRDMQEMRELRLQKLRADAELATQKAADYNRDHIPVKDALFVLETFNKALWGCIRDSGFLSYQQELDLGNRVQRAVISAMREVGFDESLIKAREQEVAASERKFSEDLKTGRIPVFVRLYHVGCFMVNANHGIVGTAVGRCAVRFR